MTIRAWFAISLTLLAGCADDVVVLTSTVARQLTPDVPGAPHCVTMLGWHSDIVGLQTAPGLPSLIGISFGDGQSVSASLGVTGNVVYACVQGLATAIRFNGTSFDVEPTDRVCDAVTADDDGILVLTLDGRVSEFANEAALRAGAPSFTWTGSTISRIAVQGDHVIGAWHSGDHVSIFDRTTGALERMVPLEGHDDWILGLDELEDGRLIVVVPNGIATFDAEGHRITQGQLGATGRAGVDGGHAVDGIACSVAALAIPLPSPAPSE